MKALMFLLGMFDSVNKCLVGETEARSIIQHQKLKRAMHSVRQIVKCDEGAFQVLLIPNALGLARAQSDGMQSGAHSNMYWWLNGETEPQRRRQYLNCSLSEVSDFQVLIIGWS